MSSPSLHLPSHTFRNCSATSILGNYFLSSLWGLYWKVNNVPLFPYSKDALWKRGPNTLDMSMAWQPDNNFSALEAASMRKNFLSWFFCRDISWQLLVISATPKNDKSVLIYWAVASQIWAPFTSSSYWQ